ncbi:MAG: 16S rRNA (cytidine(1402)-2'-O)-methyltransferase [Chloroflexi bacterium]|nr:16S rRNA (cytidine(1402)-2'-O)-methyltransferase [Chloroflexota bacterium]
MLYIVSMPIGNPEDITLRALHVLQQVDAIVCEERREAMRLLRHYQIDPVLIDLNEHNEQVRIPELLERLEHQETLALISDHGTPLLADPGTRWVAQVIQRRLPVSPVPGTSSLLAALVVSGLPMDRFRFVGLLPAKKPERLAALARLKREPDTCVVLEVPYRLAPLLTDLNAVLGSARRIAVGCDLTMPTEQVIRGTTQNVLEYFLKHPFKGEFVIVIDGARADLRRTEFRSRRLNG